MTEYEPDDPHGDAHDATPHVDLPDHPHDGAFSDAPPPPLGDLGAAHAPLPDELHFPGDETAPAVAAGDDLDPSAPWPDDDRFSAWLGEPGDAPPDDPGGDGLREQLAPPGEADGGPASPDALVEWALRRLEDG